MLAPGIVDVLQVSEVTVGSAGAVLALLLCGSYCSEGNFCSEMTMRFTVMYFKADGIFRS